MNDKLNLEVTIKPALTVERIREELADMCGLPINDETRAEIVRRLNAIGLFDFSVEAKPTCTDERPCVNCFSGQGECEVKQEADDLTQFLEQTDFDAAEKVASDTVANQRELPAGEDDCEGCKI